jgi:hypothetical protein
LKNISNRCRIRLAMDRIKMEKMNGRRRVYDFR